MVLLGSGFSRYPNIERRERNGLYIPTHALFFLQTLLLTYIDRWIHRHNLHNIDTWIDRNNLHNIDK